MLFISTIFAQQDSMIATVTLSIDIGVILAEKLEHILGVGYYVFDKIINLEWQRLICINITIALTLTFRALKFPLLGESL